MIIKKFALLNTLDNETIMLWKVFNEKKNMDKNIFLTHGTFSNKNICLGISKYLANLGFTCYIMEWRGHGDSLITKNRFNFETIALHDIKTTFNYLFEDLKIPFIHCVTHSGGGIALSMLLIKNKIYQNRIKSITMFACQAFGAAYTKTNKVKIFFSKCLTYLIGYIPAQKIKLGPHNESYYTMKQWFDWNLKKKFYSTDGSYDYMKNMSNVTVPIYSISAKGDTFIAPSKGCELFLTLFLNPYNVFQEFSVENGNLEDYNHSRIIMSRNSAKEIWPLVLNWIKKTDIQENSLSNVG